MIDGAKVNVMSAIDMMVESLKRIILDDSDEKLILSTYYVSVRRRRLLKSTDR